jgi:hypothetical protein
MADKDKTKRRTVVKKSVSTSGWRGIRPGTIIFLFGTDVRWDCEWCVISDVGEKIMRHISDGDLGTTGTANQNFARQLQKRHYYA